MESLVTYIGTPYSDRGLYTDITSSPYQLVIKKLFIWKNFYFFTKKYFIKFLGFFIGCEIEIISHDNPPDLGGSFFRCVIVKINKNSKITPNIQRFIVLAKK